MIAHLVTIGVLMAAMTLFFPVEGKTALKLRFVRGIIFDSAIVQHHGRSQHGDDI